MTAAPAPAGPYSHATIAGPFIYVASMAALDPTTTEAVRGSFEAKCRRALCNLRLVVEGVGSSLTRSVRVGVFLTDLADTSAMNAVFEEFFGEPWPARTTVQSDLGELAVAFDAVLFDPLLTLSDH